MENESISNVGNRYIKFAWLDLQHLPAIGKQDHQPKGRRLMRCYETGHFRGEYLEAFPAKKIKRLLHPPCGSCIYCGRDRDERGDKIKLTSEHIIPEFLGAGLELPQASCSECQCVTSTFEDALATQMFDPIRKAFSLEGKKGVLRKTHFPLDIGERVTEHTHINEKYYPTILALPALYPASSYSRRPHGEQGILNIRIYNINADIKKLEKYSLEKFSSLHIDLVRFSQMLAKIAHVFAVYFYGKNTFSSTLTDFIRTTYLDGEPCSEHFSHIGSILSIRDEASENLHEIEAGRMEWNGVLYYAVRIRLFAVCDMPSYYITVGV